ncbi:effector-associated domain EAD1-containing protein [Streptomyces sp. NPDC005574]|uniref:effector-associated domain EAD1-containing protein n=1 Tax=Streptomyces sp. NPDC005574 TaxID=3156891 RepID=UPI0033A2FD12
MSALIDEYAFNLDDERARTLLRALIAVYGSAQRARQLILSAGLREADVNWHSGMADVWPEALEKAAPAGLLRALVEKAAKDPNTKGHPVFEYLLSEETSSPESDPCSTHLVNNRQRAFIDRVAFRATLHGMINGDGNRVMAVQGRRRSGRTHSWYLIAHVLDSHGVNRRRIRMSDYGTPVRVADIGHTLREMFGWNLSVDPNTSEDSQARSLVNQIGNVMSEQRAVGAGVGHWLVIDDSQSVRFTEPALRALTRLVSAVVEEEMADRLRIVLLAYDGWLPDDVQSYVSHEEFSPLVGKDLHDFVLAVAEEAGRPIDPDQVDHLANELSSRAGGGHIAADAPLLMTDGLQRAAASWARDQFACGGG